MTCKNIPHESFMTWWMHWQALLKVCSPIKYCTAHQRKRHIYPVPLQYKPLLVHHHLQLLLWVQWEEWLLSLGFLIGVHGYPCQLCQLMAKQKLFSKFFFFPFFCFFYWCTDSSIWNTMICCFSNPPLGVLTQWEPAILPDMLIKLLLLLLLLSLLSLSLSSMGIKHRN